MTNTDLIVKAKKCASGLPFSVDLETGEIINLLCERLEAAQRTAKKWIALKEEVAKFYIDDENETECDGNLLSIGEVAAIHLGFL